MYISKIEMELYDERQEALVGRCFLVSGVGAFILLSYMGWISLQYNSFAVLGVMMLVAPGFIILSNSEETEMTFYCFFVNQTKQLGLNGSLTMLFPRRRGLLMCDDNLTN
jgi:hypothetical protein